MRPFNRRFFAKYRVWLISGVILLVISSSLFLYAKMAVLERFNRIQALQSNNTVFFDNDQQPFHVIRGLEDRRYTELSQISRNLQMAVVAIEDSRFFKHFGFDPIRMTAAFLRLFKKDASIQGASTITQQLVKLTLLSPEIKLSRKIKEIFQAMILEMAYSKAQILEFYLNKVYLGHGNYGVENASLNYFHKSTGDLSLAESAFIAGLIKKPEGYSPFVNLKMARHRQVLVLKRLRVLGWITNEDYFTSVNEHLFIRQYRPSDTLFAPYFVNHILLGLKQKYGHQMIYGGGLRIYTTLDRSMQSAMNQVIQKRLSQPKSFEEIAGVSVDPASGHVRALVGGANFFKSEFNRSTQAKRQPGSSFKPILYASALIKGLKPNDVFWDEPMQYTRLHEGILESYEPQNFSGDHQGLITVAYALRSSNNVVSVKILNEIGIPSLIRTARRFGIGLPEDRGLCLALGCGEISLLRLVNAYSVFANGGLLHQPKFVLKVTDSKGNLIELNHEAENSRVLTEDQAFQMNRMLQDVVNFGTGRNARIGQMSGGKTGTSDQHRDAWYVGYTKNLVTGFWIGNDDNKPMDDEVGGRTPAKLWKSYMNAQTKTVEPANFTINEKFEEYLICDHSGKLATSLCPQATWYALDKKNPPKHFCDIHQGQILEYKICRTSGKLATRYCPVSQITTEKFISGTEPDTFCDIHKPSDSE